MLRLSVDLPSDRMSTLSTRQGSAAPGIPSAAEHLIRQLAAFADQAQAFLEASTIQYRPEDSDSIVIQLWHDYRWGPLDNPGQQLQRQLLETWGPLMERIRLLLGGDPSATQQRLDEVDAFVTRWLDRPTGEFDFTIPKTISEAKERFRAEVAPCFELLGSLGQSAGATTVVPDTNVLIRSPDVARYDRVLGVSAYTVVLIPPVLAELDALRSVESAPRCARRPASSASGSRSGAGVASCTVASRCRGRLPCGPRAASPTSEAEHA
jgi:hypothetical protein